MSEPIFRIHDVRNAKPNSKLALTKKQFLPLNVLLCFVFRLILIKNKPLYSLNVT